MGDDLTVVIVDDDRDMREIMEAMFKMVGFRVHLAENAEEALTAVQVAVPDAMVLDVRMPRVSGSDIARMVKASPRTQGVLTVACTGMARGDYDEEPFDIAVQKPADLIELARRVRTHLVRRRTAGRGVRRRPSEDRPSSGHMSVA